MPINEYYIGVVIVILLRKVCWYAFILRGVVFFDGLEKVIERNIVF